nr:GNAT family N-acetyltransferase [Kaistia hirudinis]
MAGGSGRRVLLFPDLPLDGLAATAIRGFAERSGRPAVEIGAYARATLLLRPGAAPLRDTLERRRRKEFARQWRRLAEQGELAFRRLRDGPDFERAALAFLALEAGGWKGRQGTALAADPKSRSFALAALLGSLPGMATIDELLLGGDPIAMLASFQSGGRAVSWKIAYDERFARFSPGVQLMLEASDAWAAAGDVALVDSLAAAGHPMIDGLWPDRIRIGLLALGPPGGSALFSLAVRSAEAEATLRQKLRALRKRRRKEALREEKAS